MTEDADAVDMPTHGVRADGKSASCGMETDGVIDCHACVQADTDKFLGTLTEEERLSLEKLTGLVEARGLAGLAERDIPVCDLGINHCNVHSSHAGSRSRLG
jgi:oxalate---CoA ligase